MYSVTWNVPCIWESLSDLWSCLLQFIIKEGVPACERPEAGWWLSRAAEYWGPGCSQSKEELRHTDVPHLPAAPTVDGIERAGGFYGWIPGARNATPL